MKARARNQAGKALTAEFAVALTVFLLITMFPLINLIGFAMGAGTQYLMTVQCAGGAGASTTFNDALAAMDREAVLFANSGFGQFAKLHPVGGHNGTGTDLYLIETSLSASNSLAYGPNTGGPATLNSNNNVYEYQVRSTFDVGPFVNMASMPWVGDIPGVGRPARLSFVAHRNCEFTEGLAMGATGVPIVAAAGGGGSSGGSSGTGVTGVTTTGVASAASGSSGPYTVASSGGTSTDPNIIARNRGSSASNSSGGGGLADRRRRRNNSSNSSGGASVAGITNTSSSTSNYSSTQNQSYGASQTDGSNSTSITGGATGASNSTDGGQSTSLTTPTASAIGNGALSNDASTIANADGSNSSNYNYNATTGPTTNGGIVSSQSQSGSGNQNSSSSQSSNQSP